MINVTLTFSGVPELLEFFTSIGAPATAVKVETAPTPKPKRAAPAPAPAPEPVAAPPQATATPTEAPAPAVAPAPAPEPAPAPAPEPEPAPAPEPEPIIDYAQLQKAVLALYTRDRAKAAGIATDMGFASFKVMPAERWAEALAKVNAALEA